MTTYSHSNLAPLRKSRGLSQQRLAEILGAHLVTISKLETGKTPLTANWLVRFADALKVDPRDIDKSFAQANVFKLNKFVTDRGRVDTIEGSDKLVVIDETAPWADEIVWVAVTSDSLYPVYREGDILKVAYDKTTQVWAYIRRVCMISVEGVFSQAYDIVATPVHFDDDGRVDVVHTNGSISTGLRYFRVGVVISTYQRALRNISSDPLDWLQEP